MPSMGLSYQAGLNVLKDLPTTSAPVLRLQQAGLLALQASLLPAAKTVRPPSLAQGACDRCAPATGGAFANRARAPAPSVVPPCRAGRRLRQHAAAAAAAARPSRRWRRCAAWRAPPATWSSCSSCPRPPAEQAVARRPAARRRATTTRRTPCWRPPFSSCGRSCTTAPTPVRRRLWPHPATPAACPLSQSGCAALLRVVGCAAGGAEARKGEAAARRAAEELRQFLSGVPQAVRGARSYACLRLKAMSQELANLLEFDARVGGHHAKAHQEEEEEDLGGGAGAMQVDGDDA